MMLTKAERLAIARAEAESHRRQAARLREGKCGSLVGDENAKRWSLRHDYLAGVFAAETRRLQGGRMPPSDKATG